MVKLDMFQTHAMGKCPVGFLVEIMARLEILKTPATLMKRVMGVERVVLSAVELKIHAMPTRHVMELGKYDMFAQLMRATGNVLQDT